MIRSYSVLLWACFSLLFGEDVDSIWTARFVVTMDGPRRIVENGAVAVRGERIVAVGPRADIVTRYQPKQRLDRGDAILMPGLIDTHTHAPMSLFRGIADDRRLQDWLENYIFPAEAKNVDREFVRWGTRLACLEMALSGTTTYTDMYYFEDAIAEETKNAGLRGVLGETVIGFPAPDFKTPQETLAGTERYIQRFKGDPLIVPAVAPHSIYTLSEEYLKASRALADRYGVPLLIHLSETRKENQDSLAKHKMTPTALLESLGLLNGRTLGAHGVWLDDNDLRILKSHGTGLAHCPSSNAKLGSGVARVPEILKAGIDMGLGTDGFAGSNNDASLFEEMDLAAKVQKITRLDPTVLPAQTTLEMATITGARALGMGKEIGSLEPGKRADMITVNLDQPRGVPVYNVYSEIVYALKAGDVWDVMVNGAPIVRDRRMLTLNARQIMDKAMDYRRKVSASLAK
jgi:5-methylthioadenosine/S-adenosylhomocysteine deaminase